MSIYVVATMKVLDPSCLEAYGAIAGPLVKHYGGEYVAQSAAPEIVEGDWPAGFQTIVLRWPSREAFMAFWDSPEYAKAKEIRKGKIILNNAILDEAG
ncbi:DUF1330 domain-containing protein [Emcibacter sp. SYSU 3D8]|uniref:DUF1330 domain-containing protein n=1 Tax=Emcibacter sp. SYSU 3D8 TaxID=3133969 RepID=UPI0031FEB6D4